MANLERVRAHVEILLSVRDKIAELKVLEQSARDQIEAAMGHDEVGQLDGKTVITWASHKKRQLQQKALREVYPEIAEQFIETVEVRTFKVVDQ